MYGVRACGLSERARFSVACLGSVRILVFVLFLPDDYCLIGFSISCLISV